MLFTYNKCLARVSIQRLIFTGTVATVFMVFILYIALNNSESKKTIHNEILIEKMDYNVAIEKNVQIDMDWSDNEEYESFIENGEHMPELSDSEMQRLAQRMADRRQHVKNVCRDLEIDKGGNVNAYEFLINNKYHLIWCNIFKAASTSWMYNFNLMAGFSKWEATNSQQPQAMARERYPRPSAEELMTASVNATSMIIVRHPFVRLSSAYRDKMQNCPPMSMYANLAEQIVMGYRIRDNSNSEESIFYPQWPTFEEFARYVMDEAESGKPMDVHWAPYVPFCTPCHFDFDVIAKFETLEDDQKYLIQKAGLNNVITPQWRNSGGSKVMHQGLSSNDLMDMHYSQLTENQITQLYEIYKYDFLLFNYTMEEYYPLARNFSDTVSFEIYDRSSEESYSS